ncbi:MAG TPA: STAS domain-containing protein [Acidimicrobiales bacterium]|jgi:anti-sigma B factor antagonist|nr:STAS domain-containing protein [Acidimicrobiales bacterium]
MNDVLTVSVARDRGVPVVTAIGEVDVSTAPLLRDGLLGVPADEPLVVVDLSEVTFLDSTGISVLVAARKRALGASVRLVVTRPQIAKVLEVTGLASQFEVVAARREALPARS